MYRDQTAETVITKDNVIANLELLVKNVINAKIISMGFQIVKPQQPPPPPPQPPQRQPPPPQQQPQPPQLYLKHQVSWTTDTQRELFFKK